MSHTYTSLEGASFFLPFTRLCIKMKCGCLLVVMFFILLLRLFEIQLVGDLGIGTCVLSK